MISSAILITLFIMALPTVVIISRLPAKIQSIVVGNAILFDILFFMPLGLMADTVFGSMRDLAAALGFLLITYIFSFKIERSVIKLSWYRWSPPSKIILLLGLTSLVGCLIHIGLGILLGIMTYGYYKLTQIEFRVFTLSLVKIPKRKLWFFS